MRQSSPADFCRKAILERVFPLVGAHLLAVPSGIRFRLFIADFADVAHDSRGIRVAPCPIEWSGFAGSAVAQGRKPKLRSPGFAGEQCGELRTFTPFS